MNLTVVKLVNRTDRKFKFMYSGLEFEVPARGELDVTVDCANHARKKSVMQYDYETGKAEYQLGIKGIHDTSPLGKGKTPDEELIDRRTVADSSEAVVINVRGGEPTRESERDALRGGDE